VTPSTPYPRITDGEFRAFQEVIHREAGIWLADSKKALLTGRLSRRLRELDLPSFGAYFRQVTEVAPEERVRMLDCICTNETRFFREPRQFEFIEQEVLPAWTAAAAAGARPRKIRVWSAGCSTGEEPYSIAMMLLSHCPPAAGWEIEVLATDLSTRVLARAEEGVWPMEDAREIPEPYLRRFMLRGVRTREGTMKAGPQLRGVVRFQRLNLNGDDYAVSGSFDLVFCRNVLIYFDAEGKSRVLSRLRDRVSPEGYLLLGHAESLNPSPGWIGVRPNVYTRGIRPGGRPPAIS
jgi:chemotaxis protein methyltransferase CheR